MIYILYVSKQCVISKMSINVVNFNNLIYTNSSNIGIYDKDICLLVDGQKNMIKGKILGNYNFFVLKESEKDIEGFNDFEADNMINVITQKIDKLIII